MSLESLFAVCNFVALAAWSALLFFPRSRYAAKLIPTFIVPLLFAGIYGALMVAYWGRGGEGGFGSIAEVQALFEVPGLLLAGWIHYLTFDLFVGSWEVRDAQQRGIPHRMTAPCLVLTLALGPIGLAFYLCLRTAHRRA